MQSVIETAYGGHVTALFSTGAGGDIKIAVVTEDGSQFRYTNLEDCRRYGTMIAAETVKVAEALREGMALTSVPTEVQLLLLGRDIALFAVPGELFVEVGLKIKQAMELPGSFVVAYANGYTGYLPSRRAEEWGWCAHDDSYKATPYPSNFSGGIEEVLVDAARELVSRERGPALREPT